MRALVILAIAVGHLAVYWAVSNLGVHIAATATGERQRIALRGGGGIELDTQSRAQVREGRTVTEVYMTGQAYFHVPHDPSRQMIVHAGSIVIRDVGTSFNVRTEQDGSVSVIVAEGIVDVDAYQLPGACGIGPRDQFRSAIRAGNTDIRSREIAWAHQDVGGCVRLHTGRLSTDLMTRRLAWVLGVLIFKDTPLSNAIAEINRYNTEQILVDDAVKNRKIGGTYPTNDRQRFVKTLTALYPDLQVLEVAPHRLFVTTRDPAR